MIDIDLVELEPTAAAVSACVRDNAIETLNVAGPRQSHYPEMYPFVKKVMAGVIALLG